MAGVLSRLSFATAAENQLKQRKHCKKHCFLVVGLEKVVFREGNCQGNRKLQGSYRSWKTWKVMEFNNSFPRP